MTKSSSDPMTISQGPISDTEAMLMAERDHSSSPTILPPNDTLSNGLSQQSLEPKQNGHTNNNNSSNNVHKSNGHPTANGNSFNSEVYVYLFSMCLKIKFTTPSICVNSDHIL